MISDERWFEAIVNSLTEIDAELNGIKLPGFPAPSIVDLTITNGASVGMLKSAFELYASVIAYSKKYERPITNASTVLDFGCGWGRIARYFLREIPLSNLYGVDVVPKLIETCRETFNSENFSAIQQRGTLPHSDKSFDVVFANSVFSHLDEGLNLKWLDEIHRVLKPGGLAMLTIVTEEKFDLLATGAKEWIDSLDFEMDDVQKDLASGNLVWISTRRKHELKGYGLAVIPPSWIHTNWSERFEVLEMDDEQSQTIVVLRKKAGFFSKLFSASS